MKKTVGLKCDIGDTGSIRAITKNSNHFTKFYNVLVLQILKFKNHFIKFISFSNVKENFLLEIGRSLLDTLLTSSSSETYFAAENSCSRRCEKQKTSVSSSCRDRFSVPNSNPRCSASSPASLIISACIRSDFEFHINISKII